MLPDRIYNGSLHKRNREPLGVAPGSSWRYKPETGQDSQEIKVKMSQKWRNNSAPCFIINQLIFFFFKITVQPPCNRPPTHTHTHFILFMDDTWSLHWSSESFLLAWRYSLSNAAFISMWVQSLLWLHHKPTIAVNCTFMLILNFDVKKKMHNGVCSQLLHTKLSDRDALRHKGRQATFSLMLSLLRFCESVTCWCTKWSLPKYVAPTWGSFWSASGTSPSRDYILHIAEQLSQAAKTALPNFFSSVFLTGMHMFRIR